MTKTTLRRAAVASALALATGLAAPAAASALNVYAASSLRDVFTQIDASPTFNFLGSNVLQTQIERGAPADVFASASTAEPQALFQKGKCDRPVTFATNKLVMIVAKGNPKHLASVYRLRPGGFRLAVGNPGVPIGVYTRALLRRLGLSRILTANTVSSEPNVASIVSKIALGSADAGFAYVTDGRIAADRTDMVKLPRYAQPPVRYQICRVQRSGADSGGAAAFIAKVRSARGRGLLQAAGFGLPPS